MPSPNNNAPKFAIIISWSDHPGDQTFVADVPELPGCTASGDTQEEALAGAQEAIALWLDVCQEVGDPLPTPGAISDIMRSEYIDLKKRGIAQAAPDVLRAQIDSLCQERHRNGKADVLD